MDDVIEVNWPKFLSKIEKEIDKLVSESMNRIDAKITREFHKSYHEK
jgi:hypothetical protein